MKTKILGYGIRHKDESYQEAVDEYCMDHSILLETHKQARRSLRRETLSYEKSHCPEIKIFKVTVSECND